MGILAFILSKTRFAQQLPLSVRPFTANPLSTVQRSMSSDSASNSAKKESVWDYPRPPALEATSKRLRVVYVDPKDGSEIVLADTKNGYRVLETSHPPTYYLPPEDCALDKLKTNSRHTFCEWKGSATYFDFSPPNGEQSVNNRVWKYETPTPRFAKIKDYLSFYVGPWKCFVDDEEVKAQPGDFYGGWMTSDIDGGKKGVKGGPGTWGW